MVWVWNAVPYWLLLSAPKIKNAAQGGYAAEDG